jgi:hypothetical protein
MAKRKPPPGYERHQLDPNLIRKRVPLTLAQAMYPNHRSDYRPPPPKPIKQGAREH